MFFNYVPHVSLNFGKERGMKKIELTTFYLSKNLLLARIGVGFFLFLLVKAKGLVAIPVYTRLLGSEGLGIMTLIITTASLLIPIFRLNSVYGFAIYSVHLKDKALIRRNFYSSFLFSAIIASICLLITLLVGKNFLPISISNYIWVLISYIIAVIIRDYGLAVPKTFQKSKVITLFTLFTEYGGLILSILLVYFGFGPSGAVGGYIISYGICSLILYYLLYLEIGFAFKIDWQIAKKMALISLPLLPISFAQWVVQGIDQYFISYFYGVSQVGIYSVAVGITMSLTIVQSSLAFTYGATLLKLWNEKKEKDFYLYITYTLKWIPMILVLAIVLFYLGSSPIVRLLAGDGFIQAARVVPILALAYSVLTINSILEQMFYVIKKPKLVLLVFLVTAFLNIILNFILIPSYGIIGAGVATAISYGGACLLSASLIRRNFELSLKIDAYFKIAVAGVIVAGLSYLVKSGGSLTFPSFIGYTILFSLLYFAILVLLRFVEKYELSLLTGFLKRGYAYVRQSK